MTALLNAPSQTNLPYAARILIRLFKHADTGSLTLTLPTGEHIQFQGAKLGSDAKLHIKDWRAFSRILRAADIGLAEAYRDHWLDTDDLTSLLHWAMDNEPAIEAVFKGSFWGTLFYKLRHFIGRRNTKAGSKKNIQAHYDLGNDFYKRWLDPSMTYSSAFFENHNESLEPAQARKYQRIIDRLGIAGPQHVLEIGCGWGGFAEQLLTHTAARVTGLSLSPSQLAWADQRLLDKGVADRADLRLQDYRDVRGEFDAIVSIEMIEAVGQAYWPSYFRQLHDRVKPGGGIAVQVITIADELFDDYVSGTDFIQQYIFPGGMLLSLSEVKRQAALAGLEVTDVDHFGRDYAETLRRWRAQFETTLKDIEALGFDDAFVRIWRFYLCYCEAAFDAHRTDVCQVFLRRPVRPLTQESPS